MTPHDHGLQGTLRLLHTLAIPELRFLRTQAYSICAGATSCTFHLLLKLTARATSIKNASSPQPGCESLATDDSYRPTSAGLSQSLSVKLKVA